MSTIGFPTSSAQNFVRLPQYVEEVTYGTTPTSPTFVDASVISNFSDTWTTENEKYRRLGSRKIYKAIKTGRAFAFSATWSPVDTALIRYATEGENGTGTIERGLTFLVSYKMNSAGALTEFYELRKGCKIDSLTVTLDAGGLVEVSADFVCREITAPATTHGLTSPVFATATTSTPWSHLTAGGNPITLDGVAYPIRSASFTVSNGLDSVRVVGSELVEELKATAQEVTFSFDVVIGKDQNLEADLQGLTTISNATMNLNSTGPKVATFEELWIEGKTINWDSGNNTAMTMTLTGSASAVTVTA